MDCPLAKRHYREIELRVQANSPGGRGSATTVRVHDVDWKADRFHDLRFHQDQRRTRESHWHERLDGVKKLRSDSLKMFDQAREETWMGMEHEPDTAS